MRMKNQLGLKSKERYCNVGQLSLLLFSSIQNNIMLHFTVAILPFLFWCIKINIIFTIHSFKKLFAHVKLLLTRVLLFTRVKCQFCSDLRYLATSGPAHIRIRDLTGYGIIWLNTASSVGLNTCYNVFIHCCCICNKLSFI